MLPLLRLSTRSERCWLCIVNKRTKLNLKPLSPYRSKEGFLIFQPFSSRFSSLKVLFKCHPIQRIILDSLTSGLESVSASSSLWQGFSPALNSNMGILQFLPHSCTVASSMPQIPLVNTHRVG